MGIDCERSQIFWSYISKFVWKTLHIHAFCIQSFQTLIRFKPCFYRAYSAFLHVAQVSYGYIKSHGNE